MPIMETMKNFKKELTAKAPSEKLDNHNSKVAAALERVKKHSFILGYDSVKKEMRVISAFADWNEPGPYGLSLRELGFIRVQEMDEELLGSDPLQTRELLLDAVGTPEECWAKIDQVIPWLAP